MGLADIALGIGQAARATTQQVANIIEFIEAPWGLGGGESPLRLFPVQRVILKAHYGLELDDTTKDVAISDWRRDHWQHFTEVEYLKWLFDQGRCNIREVIPGEERRELVLPVGRRSGKTFLAAAIAAYETYKLILKECPQRFYGLPVSNVIQIISVATDKDQAGLLYNEASGHFRNCSFFAPYTANNTLSYARFQTPFDIGRYGRYADDSSANATLKVTFRSCIAKGLRGAGNLVVILDELAHFTDGGQSSAKEVYDAVTPSTSAFSPKDPTDPRIPISDVEGRIVSISSPLGRQGQFYKLWEIGMKGGRAAANMLCIQAPTWEVNPTVPAHEFEKHYAKDPAVFFTEYGAEFSDRTRGWIEREEDLMACVVPGRQPVTAGPARQPHFIGIDLGLVNDATAVAIGHIDPNRQIVLDYVDQIKAGEGKYAACERLDFDDVAEWVWELSRRFYLAAGIFDQWSGIPFEQALSKRGLRQLKAEHMTKNLNSQIYQNFKDMLFDQRVALYDWPIPTDGSSQHCPYITELLELQAEHKSKYITLVQAPNMDGKHDDRSDALVRMVWVASQYLVKPKYIAKGTTITAAGAGGLGGEAAYRKSRLRAKQMGSSPDRQESRVSRGRIRGRW